MSLELDNRQGLIKLGDVIYEQVKFDSTGINDDSKIIDSIGNIIPNNINEDGQPDYDFIELYRKKDDQMSPIGAIYDVIKNSSGGNHIITESSYDLGDMNDIVLYREFGNIRDDPRLVALPPSAFNRSGGRRKSHRRKSQRRKRKMTKKMNRRRRSTRKQYRS